MPFYGGGEEGNRRTVSLLRKFGYKVRVIKKIRSKATTTPFLKYLTYPFRTIYNILIFSIILIFGSRRAIVHISGFYGPTVFCEYLFVILAKLLNYNIVYEMRGGGAETFHQQGSALYRHCFRQIVRKSNVIFSQGIENEPFLKTLANTPVFYYPNFVESDFLPKSLPQKPKSPVNIVYFGRVEQPKNVKLIVEAVSIIQKSADATLTITGIGQQQYVDEVKTMMNNMLKSGTYSFVPGHRHTDIMNQLSDKHFILFPSVLPREGQSNALTESMSYGVVPISSPQGFSRTVIGDNNLIINDLSAQSYANRVLEIIGDNSFDKKSEFVYSRVAENYSELAVGMRLKAQYDKLFARQQR